MKIKELNIKAFGKFKDKSVTLKEGINLIYGLNESGKSTLHQFIESMLFGFIKEGYKTKRYRETYQKYEPLEQLIYAGEMVFEHEGGLYRCKRVFNKNNEKIEMISLEDGMMTQNIDMKDFLGVQYKHFINGNSIAQGLGAVEKDYYSKIEEEMRMVNDKRFENGLFLRVKDYFIKKREAIGNESRAKTSPYGKLKAKLAEIEVEERELKKIENDYRELLNRLKQIEKELVELKDISEAIDRQEEKFKLKRQYEDYALYRELLMDLEAMEKRLGELEGLGQADEKSLLEMRAIDMEKANLNQQIKSSEQYYASRKEDLEAFKTSLPVGLKGIEILGVIGGIAFFAVMQQGIRWGGLALSLVLTLVLIGQKLTENKKKLQLTSRLNQLNQEAEESMAAYQKSKLDLIKKERAILQRAGVSSLEDYEDILALNIEKNQLRASWQTQKFLIGERYSDMAFFRYDEQLAQRLEGLSWEEMDCEADRQALKQQIAEKTQEKNYISGVLKGSREGKRTLAEVEEEKEFYLKELNQLEEKIQAYEAIVEVSESMVEEGMTIERQVIDEEIESYFQKITNSCYTKIDIGDNGKIKVYDSANNYWLAFEQLSEGTQKQLYFAIRMTVKQNVLGVKALPLILDEAFVEYDDYRLENMLNWLDNLGGQTLIFTCTEREKFILDKNRIPYNYIEI